MTRMTRPKAQRLFRDDGERRGKPERVQPSSFSRSGVSPAYDLVDLLTGDHGVQFGGFDALDFVRQIVVLDRATEPPGIIFSPQVKNPRFIIDAFGHLKENAHIVSAEVQLSVWTAEIEALVFAERPLGVFAYVTAMLARGSF